MSREAPKYSSKSAQRPEVQASQLAPAPAIAPGKRTRTERLPPGPAGAPPPVQQKPDAAARAARQERAALTAQWIDTATRPDLYPPPVQRKGADRTAQPASDIHHLATQGISGSATTLPHLDRIQQSFGAHDVNGIAAHVGGPAARASLAMGAEAYATGNHVAFRSRPDLHTAAHEAAHVVQQRAGVQLLGGVGTPGDAYEQQADAVADRVAQGRSAEDLLDAVAGAARTTEPRQTPANEWGGGAVQGKGAVQRRSSTGVVQFNLWDTIRAQHEARGEDTPAGGSGGQHGSFQDMEEDDAGPEIRHDHGHLDDGSGNLDESLREDPTWRDRLERAKWIAKLEAAELLRPDLVDGTAAYRHFLSGNGATRDIQYGRFLENDSSGQTVLASALEDTRQAALERHDQDLAGSEPSEGSRTYQIRTGTMSVTSGDARYPYPATENWQKAIGAHTIWIEATVTVTVTRLGDPPGERPAGSPEEGEMSSSESGPPSFSRSFDVEMTIHAEDMYNFNPGDADIATGTPDSANGRFEITGLGHEYLNRGTFTQSFQFEATMDPADSPEHSASPSDPGRASRSGRPADRRPYPTTR